MKLFLSVAFLCLACALVSSGKANALQKGGAEKDLRAGFVNGPFKVVLSYGTLIERPKEKEFGGCHDIVIGCPEDWEFQSLQSFGRELYCYDVLFKLKDGSRKLCRLDLRSFRDLSRNHSTVSFKFKDDPGTIDFVPYTRAK